jgi:hypothetical protein
MPDRDLHAELKRLLDHQEIADRLAIWCRSVDTRDFTTLTQVFHPDIVWDFGKGIVERGLDKLIGRIEAHMLGASFCGARHIHLSNLCTRFEGDTAVSDAYFFALSAGTRTFAGQTLMEFGQYHDTWQRAAQGWRIVRRDYRMDIQQGPLEILYGTAPPEMWSEGDARRLEGKR